jgi:hypothetical protein
MARKKREDALMAALTDKVKKITKGSARPAGRPQMIDVALKAAIRKSGRTYYEIGRSAGVDPSVILRFMADPDEVGRGGDIRLSSAAKLAAELGLTLT